MSDVTTGTAFNPQFFMNPPWWLGRVEAKETWNDNIAGETFTNVAEIQGWGHRYKVRIFNWHTGDLDKLPPKDMAFCQVVMPVTAGSGHGGGVTTPSIESGSVVFGFFMDGMAGQEGYIMGLLGNSNNNVPKERDKPAPNQPQKSVTPPPAGSPPGTPPTVTTTQPPTPPTGPGSLANVPVPPNVDQLSTTQLIKLLDPSKTPSSDVFKSASEARQKAKAAGLPVAEIERLVLVATVKASRQTGASAGSTGNCNQGYQQFNNTYTDGDEMRSAKVPDDRIVSSAPLSITESQHIRTDATNIQDKDMRKKIPLLDVCKDGKSEDKGIQTVMQNLLNDIEDLKKQFNQVSAFATEVEAYSAEVQTKVLGAIEEISGYLKNTLTAARGFVLTEFNKQIDKISPQLFPTEIPGLYKQVENGTSLINCLFNNLIDGLKALLANLLSKLLDQFINAPLCAVENFLSNFVDSIIGPILSTLQAILAPINALIGGISSFLSSFEGILDFISGILQFFSCDESPDCVQYDKISQDGPALPSFNFNLGLPSIGGAGGGGSLDCQTGPIVGGPPLVGIFGPTTNGSVQPIINPIISPISSSVIGFDIINPGSGFITTPTAVIFDPLGNGNGASLEINLEDDGTGGTPVTVGGTPVTVGGTGGTPVTVGGTGGTPVTVGGTPVTAGGTPVTVGGTGGTPVTVGGTPVIAGGTGGTPVIAGGTGGTPVTAGGTPVTVGGTPVTAGGTGGTSVTVGGTGVIDECDVPRNSFENVITNELNITKKIKNITIKSPGNGYLATPDGSLGGGGRVWKEPDEGYVRTKCGGYFVVQPYRPIAVKSGDTYYPPDGPSRLIEEDEVITLPLVPITPPKSESLGVTYPVILSIEEIKVLDNGFGYRPGDKLIITPDNGTETELVINEFGNIESVKVLKSGYGFLDFPQIRTNSPTGFNATFTPIFKSTRLDDFNKDNIDSLEVGNIPIINVVDCVGRV
jgi:hypothetical protein